MVYQIFLFLQQEITQQLILLIPVIKMRSETKIQAPTLYPRDSEISKLNLTEEQTDRYLRAQRAHQNNARFLRIKYAICSH